MSITLPQLKIDNHIYGTGVTALALVRVATVTNGALASEFDTGYIIDNITLAAGDRILIKNQTISSENGIYVVRTAVSPVRAEDFDEGSAVGGSHIIISEGTTNANTIWMCTNNTGSDIVNTDSLTFSQVGGTGTDGDVSGPGTSVNNNSIARWNTTSGTSIKNSNTLLIEDTLQTTDDISTAISTIATTNNTGYLITSNVVGMKVNTNGNSGAFILNAHYRNDAGVLTLLSQDVTNFGDYSVVATISGTNIILEVKGKIGDTVKWINSTKILFRS